jgi:hypothetical protein
VPGALLDIPPAGNSGTGRVALWLDVEDLRDARLCRLRRHPGATATRKGQACHELIFAEFREPKPIKREHGIVVFRAEASKLGLRLSQMQFDKLGISQKIAQGILRLCCGNEVRLLRLDARRHFVFTRELLNLDARRVVHHMAREITITTSFPL